VIEKPDLSVHDSDIVKDVKHLPDAYEMQILCQEKQFKTYEQ